MKMENGQLNGKMVYVRGLEGLGGVLTIRSAFLGGMHKKDWSILGLLLDSIVRNYQIRV